MVADGCGDVLPCGSAEAESYFIAHSGVVTPLFNRSQLLPKKYGSPFTEIRNDYMPTAEKMYPISIGRKYEQLTKLVGFSFGQAGKTMGLAPYGSRLIEFTPNSQGIEHSLCRSDYLEQLHEIYLQSGLTYTRFIQLHKVEIAYDIQKITESLLLGCLREFSAQVDTENLCLAGGIFLNCVANKKLADAHYFKNIYIMPAAGDDGQAIGAAYYVYSLKGEDFVRMKFSPYLGKQYTTSSCLGAINKLGYSGVQYENIDELISNLAQKLAQNKVIGVLQGRSEVGPRALGNRSIFASPFHLKMRDHINEHIKFREDFRPFAPIVSIERAQDFFEIEMDSPYMLYTCQVKEEFRARLPAITHVDGSARIQTISREENPFVHKLLRRFEELTGFPILVNTSFNTAFEPIIDSPEDALRTLTNSSLDAVILENIIVEGNNGKVVS
jgi:carbamoyltransferase